MRRGVRDRWAARAQNALDRARSVLDLDCGTGFPLLELAERLGRPALVVGLDPWEAALRECHRVL